MKAFKMSSAQDVNGAYLTVEETHMHGPAVTREEFERLCQQVNEIHQIMTALSNAINSPMMKAMLPPTMREMLGD